MRIVGMDFERVAQLQERVARDLVDNAPEGWERLEATVVSVAGVATTDLQATRDGVTERFDTFQALLDLPDLQEAMFDPEKGSWFSATCVVEPSGSYSFSFNYDDHVMYDEDDEPLEESWVKELRRHPRPWALIPDWHPVKRLFTEDEWAADLARHEGQD